MFSVIFLFNSLCFLLADFRFWLLQCKKQKFYTELSAKKAAFLLNSYFRTCSFMHRASILTTVSSICNSVFLSEIYQCDINSWDKTCEVTVSHRYENPKDSELIPVGEPQLFFKSRLVIQDSVFTFLKSWNFPIANPWTCQNSRTRGKSGKV